MYVFLLLMNNAKIKSIPREMLGLAINASHGILHFRKKPHGNIKSSHSLSRASTSANSCDDLK